MRLSRRQQRYIEVCLAAAEHSEYNFMHGAVLVRKSRVVKIGWNQRRHCGFSNRFFVRKHEGYFVTLHAEAAVLLGVDRKVTSGASVYVVRKNRQQEVRLSKPCETCEAMCRYVGIKKIIYSIEDNIYGELRL